MGGNLAIYGGDEEGITLY